MTRIAVSAGRSNGQYPSLLKFNHLIFGVQRAYAMLALICFGFLNPSPACAETAFPQPNSPQTGAKIVEAFGKVPLSFEQNQGQYNPDVQFLTRGAGYALSLNHGEAILALHHQAKANMVHMQLLGANLGAAATGSDQLPGATNYFIGSDPQKWHTSIPTFGKVGYSGIYPNVDLVFYGNQRQLEYDFVIQPGGEPGNIAWSFRGAQPQLGQDGDLELTTSGGTVRFLAPVAYQMVDRQRIPVSASYAVMGNTVRFALGSFDRRKPLVIDPVLSYFSYLGGTGADYVGNGRPPGYGSPSPEPTQAAGIDAQGNLYVAGSTASTDFPVINSISTTTKASGQFWAFVSKFSPDGSKLLYSTYIGGSTGGNDGAYALAVDSAGNAYVTGAAETSDFPVTSGAFQTLCAPHRNNNTGSAVATCTSNGGENAFALKLNPAGSALVYSSFLGGFGATYGTGIAVDGAGQAYLTGVASSSLCGGDVYQYGAQYECFPTTANAAISDIGGGNSVDMAFLTVFNSTGSGLVYSTLFGDTQGTVSVNGAGCQLDCGAITHGTTIALDPSGNVYIGGTTASSHLLLTTGAFNTSGSGANSSAPASLNAEYGYVAKFGPVTSSGSTLLYSTYFGGGQSAGVSEGGDVGGLTADASGNAYIAGETNASDFPATAGAYQTQCDVNERATFCDQDGYVAKLNPTGTALVWATYLGNGSNSPISALGPVITDSSQNVYVLGQGSGALPLGGGNVGAFNANPVVYVAKLNSAGSQVSFGIGVGGPGNGSERAGGFAVDTTGAIYVGGSIGSGGTYTGTPGAYQTAFAGGAADAFVAKALQQQASTTTLSLSATSATFGQGVTLTAKVAGPQGSTTIATGTVTFLSGTTTLGTGTLDSTGTATYTTATLAANNYTLTASYGGDNNYLPSTSTAQTFLVTTVATATTLTASATSATSGTGVTLTAAVAPASGSNVPTGTVTFNDGTTTLGTGTLNNSGQATYTASSLSVGSHSITAVYGGDMNNLTSTSAALTIAVTAPPQPDFGLTVSPTSGSVAAGTPASVTVTVTPQNGFNAATTFACSGLPAQSTCTFNPATVTPNGAAATTTLTIGSTANTAVAAAGALLSLLLVPVVGRRSRKQRGFLAALAVALLLAATLGFSGCGGGSSKNNTTSNANNGTPAGTYTVTVTATSGSLNHTATYSFTIN